MDHVREHSKYQSTRSGIIRMQKLRKLIACKKAQASDFESSVGLALNASYYRRESSLVYEAQPYQHSNLFNLFNDITCLMTSSLLLYFLGKPSLFLSYLQISFMVSVSDNWQKPDWLPRPIQLLVPLISPLGFSLRMRLL